ncbi:hypothetical protein GE107_16195 [Cohnella sp. CFH 77786]|uniref:hypothetical protein n=1 Tax=Cohnella sp. CFH 77786 TaxID=2662265 RepID=UPI001C6082DB|nr:hypothetical protein [Cohnella sp. CFH 77786]MBW5447599.1 hypothetical protein [Cohnella sp. CFH 77786]
MNPKRIWWIGLSILMLSACGNRPDLVASKVERNQDAPSSQTQQSDPILEFQREVIPIVESAVHAQFPKADYGDAFFAQADYYYDNDNLKVVFLVDKEHTKEMTAIRKELEDKLRDKVVFKKAKYNPKFLQDTAKEVSDYLFSKTLSGYNSNSSHSVGYNTKEEAIEIKGKFNDEQIADLKQHFNADMLKITNEEFHSGF